MGYIWVFPKIGVFPPKWMVKIMEKPIKMDDLGVPLFSETPTIILVGVYHLPKGTTIFKTVVDFQGIYIYIYYIYPAHLNTSP